MVFIFLALIVILSVALGFVILVQNPKGGGLAESVGGIGNQFMGVKQTTDVLEKGTWIFAGAIAILAIVSTVFLKGGPTTGGIENSAIQKINTTTAPTQNQATPKAK